MPKAQSQELPARNVSGREAIGTPEAEGQGIVAAALLSFLKEIGGTQTWTEKDLSCALKISLSRAKKAITVLQLQGYIEPAGHGGKWKVTEQGEIVSGAKSPRFSRKSIEDALAGLRERIKASNSGPDAPYKIAEAVAFGDFLGDAARLQAAGVGIRLVPKRGRPDHVFRQSALCRARLP